MSRPVVRVAKMLCATGSAVGDLRSRAHRDTEVVAGLCASPLQRPGHVLLRVRLRYEVLHPSNLRTFALISRDNASFVTLLERRFRR